MKLFLATSSLNIDNILSTESIAPLSFYQSRRYGYNFFCELKMIPFKNVLILFSKIPHFEIDDREHDSRPIILEINVDEKKNPLVFIEDYRGVKVYSTDTIIRLSPFNTRILFFNPKDLNYSLLCCSDSLTNKLGDRFQFKLCKIDFELEDLLSIYPHIHDSCRDYEQKVNQDNRLNIIKGFVFGYYLGAAKSVSSDSATLLRIQKRVYDIVATIKNNGGYGSNLFVEELDLLDKEYRRNDPNTRKCRELWNKTLKELSIPADALDRLLEEYDERHVLKNSFMQKNGLQPPVPLHRYQNYETYRDDLMRHTLSIIKEDRRTLLSDFDANRTFDLDPSYETCMLAGMDTDSMIFNKFIDVILWHGEAPTPDTLRTNRFDIATQITIYAKSIWDSLNWEWKNSSAQFFMNELRQNINSFTPFNINKQDNIILKSIAAFILKGEDYDAIVQFCEDNSYADYRYALALWGATQGYVKIPKPIFSTLINSPSFSNTYRAILSFLYNVKFDGDLPYVQEPIKTIEKKQEEQLSMLTPSGGNDAVKAWQNGISSYFNQLKNVPKKKELYTSLHKVFMQHSSLMDYGKFFTVLKDEKEWKTAKGEPVKAWKSMHEHFCLEGKEPKNNSEKVFQSTHINVDKNNPLKKRTQILEDSSSWIEYCSSLITDSKTKKQFKDDMMWFVENHNQTYEDRKKGRISGFYSGKDRSNKSVIERLRTYMENKRVGTGKTQWLATIYSNIPIDKIINYLSDKYGS